jgi:hypothetical protein
MNGYSVEEAAEVLGIPQGRVWELIARGVLAGASEGGASMRVYLRGTGPATVSASPEAEGRVNGNGHNGNGHGELSPFRELLTEFRNLTERYGQALLALGEARGEVASLRGRVELLEARMDLRLPMRSRPSAAWEMPDLPPRRATQAQPEATVAEPSAAGFAPSVPSPSDFAPSEPSPSDFAPSEPTTPEPPLASAEPVTTRDRSGPGEALVEGAEEQDAETADAMTDFTGVVDDAESVADAESGFDAMAEAEALDAEAAFEAGVELGTVDDEPKAAPAVDAVLPASEGRRGRGDSRAAIAGLAAALARAEDPVLASLPGAEEAAQALAALQREMEPASDEGHETAPASSVEPAEPPAMASEAGDGEQEPPDAAVLSGSAELTAVAPAIELAEEPLQPEATEMSIEMQDVGEWPEPQAADLGVEVQPGEEPLEAEPAAEPVAEVTDSPYTTDVIEPDWFADGDFTWLEAPEPEAEPAPEASARTEEASLAEPEPIRGEVAEPPAYEPPLADAQEMPAEPEPMTPGEEQSMLPGHQAAEPDWSVAGPEPDVAWEVPEPEGEPALEAAAPEPDEPGPEPEPIRDQVAEPPAYEPPPPEAREMPVEPEPMTPDDETDRGWPPPGDSVRGDDEVSYSPAPEASSPGQSIASPGTEISGDIQEAFAEAEPEAAAAEPEPRTEAIHIEVNEPEPAPDSDASWVTGERSRAVAASGVAGFGLFKGQPEAPPIPERPARHLPEAGEEALMWFGDEFEAEALEIAAPGWHNEEDASAEPAPRPVPAPPPALQLSDAEIEQLANQEGWEHEEVEAIRGLLGRPAHAPVPDPGDEPEAGEQLRHDEREDARDEARDDERDDERVSRTRAPDGRVAESALRGADRPLPQRTPPAGRAPQPSPDWLRGRRGPAANAYRRLRRIFPG